MARMNRRSVWFAALLFIAVAGVPLRGDVVALWDFDYDDISDAWADNHGVVRGTAYFAPGRSGAGRALELTGRGYGEIANKSHFDITGPMTVAAWIQVHSFDRQWQIIIAKGNTSWRFGRNSTTNAVEFACYGLEIPGGTIWGNLFGTRNVNDRQWHHVAGVYDGKKMYLYVDGTLDVSQLASGRIALTDKPVYIGENSEDGDRRFKGLLDDVLVCSHALDPNGIKELYTRGPASILPKTRMDQLVEEIEQVAATSPPKDAADTIRQKIVAYEQWRDNTSDRLAYRERYISPDVYFLLAQAQEAAGRPAAEVAATYGQVVREVPYRARHVADALVWLATHLPADEYGSTVREFARQSLVLSHDVHHAARRFQERGDWAAFERFLEAFFSGEDFQGESTGACLPAVWTGLRQDESWAQRFLQYCQSKRALTPFLFRPQEKLAQEYISQGNYPKAVEVYREIASRCGPEQDRARYEYQAAECAFYGNEFDSALQDLNAFIRAHRSDDYLLVSQAVMLKGRCHINLGAVDEAVDTFFDLLIEYPQTALAPEANFLMGYCLILQGRYDDAREALNLVVRDYPQSTYAAKASLYLTRLQSMTK
jgi:tetratricopeptide (TPR) repeat protein